ncbi:hypothetical protein CRG98_039231, partial [Punica granatum]
MVKFSKQFEGQLVPEWKDAFVDYWQLKKDIKKIHLLNTNNGEKSLKKEQSRISFMSSLRKLSFFGHQQRDHGAIQVHRKLASSASNGDTYETELMEHFEDSDAAKGFFTCLDHQLNKVNQFYRTKENEFLERGELLKKQMEILIELKNALKQQNGSGKGGPSEDFNDDSSVSCAITSEDDSVRDRASEEHLQDKTSDDLEKPEIPFPELLKKPDEMGKSMRMNRENSIKMTRSLSSRSFNCQGKNLRINIPLTTPTRTLSAISNLVFEDLISQSSKKLDGNKLQVNKTKLTHAKKMIRGAFIELYKGLRYLETYRNLNMLAFVKILKKFDKYTGKQVLPIYLRVVESSYFNSSNKAMRLTDEVEELFIMHFAEDDRRKAMKYLKPDQRKDSHGKTFFI